MEVWIGLGVVALIFWFISWLVGTNRRARMYDNLKPRLDNLDSAEHQFRKEQEEWRTQVEADKQAIETLAREKSLGFPWLAEAYADYFHLKDVRIARHLETKSHPAKKAADQVREIASERRKAEKLWRVLRYELEYYESLFPFLVDFKGEGLDDLIRQIMERGTQDEQQDEEEDPVRHWLTRAEYDTLSITQRNQLALDRYWQKKKSPWELGRDYERYIGYQYETAGWKVDYQGIVEGLSDLGRDLVAVGRDRVEIVQCKYWSAHKTIHEKHVFQLFGTVVAYRIDHPERAVSAVFTTSTSLSDRAKQFADALGITYREREAFRTYPCIKCNISRKDGTKIYHLPLDQQYDTTKVEKERLERYVATVGEAEGLGFRRAFRWRGAGTT